MLQRLLRRDRAVFLAAFVGMVIFTLLIEHLLFERHPPLDPRVLTAAPWYCEVDDPAGLPLVARSIETFFPDGGSEGLTRLEDRESGRLLLEFSYHGLWRLEQARLVEAISEYRYLHVDRMAFPDAALAAIEAEFAEPEVSLVHRITANELVYGVEGFVYQCRRPASMG